MKTKKLAQIIRLPVRSAQPPKQNVADSIASDEWNPIESARLASEFSKVFGPYRTPAQAYIAAKNFDLSEFLARPLKYNGLL